MKRLWSIVVLGVVLLLTSASGCSSSAVDPNTGDVLQNGGAVVGARVGETFSLRVGETAQVRGTGGDDIHVTFVSVTEDSRCPTGVQCVWEGNARLRLVVAQGGLSSSTSINTTVDPKSAAFAGHTLQLVELRPHPHVGEPISQSAYVARLRLTASS
ncbi:MAG TPA: hypothetical protein VJ672_12185 [Gemmatimonadaceae bacterium]|nr:hypothetical protein [Gemmatimonadaceae bacterium]